MASQSKPVHRRRRTVRSCLQCRRRKIRCDRARPCSQCVAHEIAASCEYRQSSTTLQHASMVSQELSPQDSSHARVQESFEGPCPPVAKPSRFTGVVSKTRVYGPGHWMATQSVVTGLSAFDVIGDCYTLAFHRNPDGDEVEGPANVFAKCKGLARAIKSRRPGRCSPVADVQRVSPGAEVMIELIELYFATFESGYRILHKPSFMNEYTSYRERPTVADDAFLLQLLLVMATAGPLHAIHNDAPRSVVTWVTIAESWLSLSLGKDRLTIKVLQCHCLLLLARQVNRIGSDLVWISCGSVLRMAIQMGLHQDPDCFDDMHIRDKEIRRRLWHSILEIDIQTALDSGTVSTICSNYYSTRLPAPLNDEDLDEKQPSSISQPQGQAVAPAWFQEQLAASLPVRLRILSIINDPRRMPPYADIVALSNEITVVCRDFATGVSQVADTAKSQPTTKFAISLCTHLLHRFSMCLHYRHALESSAQPLYSYSYRACLNETLDIIGLLDDDLYSHVLIVGGGMFRDIITRGIIILFMEINTELEASKLAATTPRRLGRLSPLIEDARRLLRYARERMVKGDTNIKAYVTLSIFIAHVEACTSGQSSEETLSQALCRALDDSHAILETMLRQEEIYQPELDNASYVPSWTTFDLEWDPLEDGIFDTSF